MNIANTAKVEAGLGSHSIYSIEPMTYGGQTFLTPARLNTALTIAEKQARGLPTDVNYVYGSIPLTKISFEIDNGYVMKVIAGANQGGVVGDYYRFLGGTAQIVPHLENFSDGARWQQLSQPEIDALPTGNVPYYDSDVTVRFGNALQNKFFVVKHAELELPTLSVRNVGNMLLAQREKVLSWIADHVGNAEALARYEAQLLTIDAKLEDLGLTEDITVGGVTRRLVKQSLDQLFLDIPALTAAPVPCTSKLMV